MRVAALVAEAYGGHGGIALYNRDLLAALCGLPGCQSVTAVPRLVPGTLGRLPELLDFRSGAARGVGAFLREWAHLARGDDRYDLVICGHINLLPLAQIVRWRHKAPLVLFIYGIDAWRPTGRRMSDWLATRVDAVVSISDITRNRFNGWAGLPEDSLFLLPNAIHLQEYGEGDKPAYLEERYSVRGKRVLMTLGRLSAAERYKGIDEVLELMSSILADVPNVLFLIVGDGDDCARLRDKAKGLGVEAQVLFAGRIPEQEKADHYRLADAFVMAGRGEGFGFVFLEAMACGVPVVASKLDGSREAVLDGELGLLADPNDLPGLKQAILKALHQPKGIPSGLSYFDFTHFCQRLERIIGGVMSRGTATP
jgi:phosphatidylinositol alpha-1,6-mannosyltransferase